ncbi:MAG: phosphatidylserine decarboxylase [Pseudomonadota bacterium]
MSMQFGMSEFFPPIHREGRPFVFGGFAVALLGFLLIGNIVGWLGLVFLGFCLFFFRDPDRYVPKQADAMIAPSDGRICAVTKAPWPAELGDLGPAGGTCTRISVFLSVLDVHVNRAPCAGRIARIAYVPGTMVNANLDKASTDNERNLVALERPDGSYVAFVQISGFVARRIICDVEEGDRLEAGERFGIIRFGSRMDIYLPEGYAPTVSLGQRTLGGETILAMPQDKASSTPMPAVRR